jgi:hypothetical protein
MNKSMSVFFKRAVSISAKSPSQTLNYIQTVNNQQKAARVSDSQAGGRQCPK